MDVARRSILASSLALPLTSGALAADERASGTQASDVTNFDVRARNGDSHTNTFAFQEAFRDASARDNNNELHRKIYTSAGRHSLNFITVDTSNNANRFALVGDGMGNTILEFQNLIGNAISIIGGMISISEMTITSSADRKGNGVEARASYQNTTQSWIRLTNVQVMDQPGDGILAISPELHRYGSVCRAAPSPGFIGSGLTEVSATS